MKTRIYKDQTGRDVEIPQFPKRIVSLVPSQTELLADLGLENELTGITKFCIHPESIFRTKTRVGGTKNVNISLVQSLQPDLIIANREENTKEQVEALALQFPVWTSDISNLDSALEMIETLGSITNRELRATEISEGIRIGFDGLSKFSSVKNRVAYFIWQRPFISVGCDTFIHHLLQKSGFSNVFGELRRYPEIDQALLAKANPDFIFLSSEPYPFKEKHVLSFQQICPGANIILVDGEMFSWYGSRLLKAPGYLQKLVEKLL